MSINLERQGERLIVLRVAGKLKKIELDAAQNEAVRDVPSAGPIKVLVLLEKFAGWERNEDWGDTDFFFRHQHDVEKMAVVGDRSWEAQVLAFTGAGLRKGPLKFFPETGEQEARAWLFE
jgi:hypothetical protein